MNSSDDQIYKAAALINRGDYEEALRILHEIPPGRQDPLKHYHIGLCYAHLGKLDKALESYKKIRELTPDELDVDYRKFMYGLYINMASIMQILGHRSLKKERIAGIKGKESHQKSPKKISETSVNPVEIIKEAISCYRYALDVDSSDPRVWNNLGNCYLDIDDYDNANECLSKAIELDDEFPEAYYSKSLVYEFMNLYEKAIEQLKKALKYRNRNRIYLLKIITLLFGLGKFEEALYYANKFKEYHPDLPEGYKFSILILYNMNRRDEAKKLLIHARSQGIDLEDKDLEDIWEDLLS